MTYFLLEFCELSECNHLLLSLNALQLGNHSFLSNPTMNQANELLLLKISCFPELHYILTTVIGVELDGASGMSTFISGVVMSLMNCKRTRK